MTPLDFIIGALCAYRLTQLVVWDGISEPATTWLSERNQYLDELLACPHCVGFWCAVLTMLLIWYSQIFPFLIWIVRAFGMAGVVSIVEHATRWLEIRTDYQRQDEA